MRSWRLDLLQFVAFTMFFVAAGCGGSSGLQDACERSCERTVKCEPDFGTLAECKQQCAQAEAKAASICLTVEKVNACLAKTSCDEYFDCALAETFCTDGAGGQNGTTNGGAGGSGAGGKNVGGSGGKTQGAGGSAGITGNVLAIGDLANDLSKATCKRLFECCTASEFSFFGDTQTQCVSTFRKGISSQIAIVQDLIDAGHIKYRGDLAATCVSNIEKATCTNALALIDGFCVESFEGLVKTGSACDDTLECVSGLFCNATGTCAPEPALGEMCLQTCAKGLGCDLNTRKCVATKPTGAACQSDSVCQSDYCDNGKCIAFPLTCTGK
jgi:hypothetical protein